jgi:hypothetical protein
VHPEQADGAADSGPGAAEAAPAAAEVPPGTGQAGPSTTETAPGTAPAGPRAGPEARPAVQRHRLDSGGLLYGTIVSAAALAVGASRGDTAGGMFETMVSTLLIYWFAHIYTATVNARQPGNTIPLYRLVAASARHEASILIGGLPAVVVVAILSLIDTSLWVTVLSDAGVVIVVLALDGLLAGLHAGTRGWRLGIEAGSAAVMGGLLAALLVSLHRH